MLTLAVIAAGIVFVTVACSGDFPVIAKPVICLIRISDG